MKTELVDESQKEVEWNFPCLGKGISDDLIVLFEHDQVGTVVFDGRKNTSKYKIGTHKCDWYIDRFAPLPTSQKVILQND